MENEHSDLLGLEFSIDVNDSSMSNGEDAYIVFLKIDNKTVKSRKINLLKAIYVTSFREQLEQDIWLSGYITGEDTLKPNSFKKAGFVFYKPKLNKISDNDAIYVTIELIKEGSELTLCFIRKEGNWTIINSEKSEIEIKLTPKQLQKTLLKRIDRLESFEDRLEVSFENLSLIIKEDFRLTILGEFHTNSGTDISEDISIVCVLYANDGSILEQSSTYIGKDDFFGFEIFEFNFYDYRIAEQVSKIRIYPKR
jgi:hypothetical protein